MNRAGLGAAALAFVWWGLFPLYFRLLTGVAATEVLAHRVVWSLAFLALLMTWRRQWAWLLPVARQPRVLGAFAASACLIGANWLCYIWAIDHGHVLEASLGYFMTPLVNTVLGMTILSERLRRGQGIALALAAAGVVWLTWQAGRPPWIALALALSFGGYGLLRKVATLGALEGLALETLLLCPLAVAVIGGMAMRGDAHFASAGSATQLAMVMLGPVTAVPLLLFAAAARRLSMTTLGLIQYVSPSLQFAIGHWFYGEPVSAARLAGFGLIWSALIVYSVDGWRASRRAAVPAVQAAA